MNRRPEKLYFLLIFFFLFLVQCGKSYVPKNVKPEKDYSSYITQAKKYSEENRLSNQFFLLADLSVHSGKKRLFLYDFKEGRFTESFLVMHGQGRKGKISRRNAEFSNEPRSFNSALGKYIVKRKKKKSASYGRKFIMKGMEETNSNSQKRLIVHHPSKYVPNREKFPKYIGNSKGCPAVSQDTFEILDDIFEDSSHDFLLWIIN